MVTLKARIRNRIARKKVEVFVPKDFKDLGGEDQVLRALRELINERQLVRLGYGVYARARVSKLSGRTILADPNGFSGVARQALTKLGVEWRPTKAERDYNDGRSTQLPVNAAVDIRGRFSRQLRFGNNELIVGRR